MNKADLADQFLGHTFPGSSEIMRSFREEIYRLNHYCQRHKGSIRCILLTGETGVGKTFAARAISAHSQWLTMSEDEKSKLFCDDKGNLRFPAEGLIDRLLMKEHLHRRGEPSRNTLRLATVLAPQLTDDLAASELFGHRKGAFTGAEEEHPGVFGDEAVEDILIDEIADLNPRVQAKLLQFIETGTFRPVGGLAEHERSSQSRLLLATNQSLTALVRKGSFREDLYYRIQGHQLHIPPLRARKEVIRELTQSVLRSVNYRHRGEEKARQALKEELKEGTPCLLPESEWEGGRPTISNWVRLTEDDLRWCEKYNWPGNIRELRHALEQFVYRDGQRTLREIMSFTREERSQDISDLEAKHIDDQSIIDVAVANYLKRVLEGAEQPPGKPGLLVERFTQMAKSSIYRFKVQNRLGRQEFKKLFPDAKDAETTVGRWKKAAI